MPRTPEQFEKIRKTKRRQIMDAALELFANEGYHSTSISNIAIKAGVSKGLMYNYFESKEELIKAIIDDGLDIIQNLFDPDKDGSLTEQEFDYFVDQTFNILKKNLNYWKLYFSTCSGESCSPPYTAVPCPCEWLPLVPPFIICLISNGLPPIVDSPVN